MADIVRVQIKTEDGYDTLAQLDRPLAETYLESLKADSFDGAMMAAIANSRSPLVRDNIEQLKRMIDNALFSSDPDAFRIIPAWTPDEV